MGAMGFSALWSSMGCLGAGAAKSVGFFGDVLFADVPGGVFLSGRIFDD